MDRKKLKKNQSGLSLLEGMIAAAIVGIGFMAVFSLSNASTSLLMSSIDREKGSMLTTMIMEDLLTDTTNINACATTCPYHDMDFRQPGVLSSDANADNTAPKKQTKWKESADKLFGSNPTTNDKRYITVKEVTDSNGDGTGVFVISIQIHSRDGRAKNIFRRNINSWPSSS